LILTRVVAPEALYFVDFEAAFARQHQKVRREKTCVREPELDGLEPPPHDPAGVLLKPQLLGPGALGSVHLALRQATEREMGGELLLRRRFVVAAQVVLVLLRRPSHGLTILRDKAGCLTTRLKAHG
jgi:hypothetical protein